MLLLNHKTLGNLFSLEAVSWKGDFKPTIENHEKVAGE